MGRKRQYFTRNNQFLREMAAKERGYGAFGAPPDIPGYSTLIFDIELVAIA